MAKNNELVQLDEEYTAEPIYSIDSMEVAEMVGKEHKELLRDIRRYCKQLNESNIAPIDLDGKEFSQRNFAPSDFFIESTHISGRGKEYPCYLVTKKGCEFIAHKLTGIKGTKFTAKYIERFHDMEDMLVNQRQHISFFNKIFFHSYYI